MLSSHPLFSLVQSGLYIIIGICGIGFLIGFHELGHFLFCKLFNIRTPSFSIGMGPRIFTKKIGETEFALSLLPLGGYVEIAGAAEVGQGDQKEAYSKDERSFASKPYYQKMLVMAGGILFNLAFAYLALSLLYFLGMPNTPFLPKGQATTLINNVQSDSPAAKAGLLKNDTIIEIDGMPIANASEAIEIINKSPDKTVTMVVKRDGSQESVPVTIGSRTIPVANKETGQPETTVGFIGVDFLIPRYGVIDSLKHGFHTTNYLISHVVEAFKKLFGINGLDNIGGPLMVISQTIKGAQQGFKIFLLLLAFISVNLAILNIIPLPIMDGGQALFYTIEAIIGRPLNEKVREYIHIITWVLLLLLIVFLSFKDVNKMVNFSSLYNKITNLFKK